MVAKTVTPGVETSNQTRMAKLRDIRTCLEGTWTNQDCPENADGQYSYNIMPLPQVSKQPTPTAPTLAYQGYILKNFRYTEKVRFNGNSASTLSGRSGADGDQGRGTDQEACEVIAVPAMAPNRGGSYEQDSYALFYDQQVKFAEGPRGPKVNHEAQVVHVENGSWLFLEPAPQTIGPYPGLTGAEKGPIAPQPPDVVIAKQMSVPHGNSILALGHVDQRNGNYVIEDKPVIPDAHRPFPTPGDISPERYKTRLRGDGDPATDKDYENPNPAWTLNPNEPLRQFVDAINPTHYIHWQVTTEPLKSGQGSVTNIPFEQRKAEVLSYRADYWLLSKDGKNFDYLAYAQTILMRMLISFNGGGTFKPYVFPHVTVNVVGRYKHTPKTPPAHGTEMED